MLPPDLAARCMHLNTTAIYSAAVNTMTDHLRYSTMSSSLLSYTFGLVFIRLNRRTNHCRFGKCHLLPSLEALGSSLLCTFYRWNRAENPPRSPYFILLLLFRSDGSSRSQSLRKRSARG